MDGILNEIFLDWLVTLTTQSSSKLSDNPIVYKAVSMCLRILVLLDHIVNVAIRKTKYSL